MNFKKNSPLRGINTIIKNTSHIMKELIPMIVDGVVRILNIVLRRKKKKKKNTDTTPTEGPIKGSYPLETTEYNVKERITNK